MQGVIARKVGITDTLYSGANARGSPTAGGNRYVSEATDVCS